MTSEQFETIMTNAKSEDALANLPITEIDRTLIRGLSLCGLAYAAYNVLTEYAKTRGWPIDALLRTAAGVLRQQADKRCKT